MTSELIERLPHRAPFLFVTRVDELVAGERGVGAWTVRGDEAFFAGHFPGDPIVPGVLLTEAMAQLSGLVAAEEGSKGRLAQVNVKLHEAVRPPAEIRLEAKVERSLGGLWLFEVAASSEGVCAASGSLALAIGRA